MRRAPHRFHAAGLHFLVSLSVFVLLVGILLFNWYPSPYFSASGGWQGLRLVAAVDLVLGPLLTLVIFNPAKSRRELFVDLGVVVLLQMGALLWGVRAVYDQRPVAVAFLDSSFYTVPAAALQSQGIDLQELARFGDQRPVFVYVEKPTTGQDLQEFERQVFQGLIPPHEQAWLYRPLSEHFAQVFRSSVDVDEIMRTNAGMKTQIEQVLEKAGGAKADFRYLPLTSRYRNILLIFDASGNLAGAVSAPYKTGEV